MTVVILIVIGIVVGMMFGNNSSEEPKKTTHPSQSKADEEFEDIFLNGASGDDIDDF